MESKFLLEIEETRAKVEPAMPSCRVSTESTGGGASVADDAELGYALVRLVVSGDTEFVGRSALRLTREPALRVEPPPFWIAENELQEDYPLLPPNQWSGERKSFTLSGAERQVIEAVTLNSIRVALRGA